MDVPAFSPLQGGVKIVFDVPAAAVEQASRTVAAAGFDVGRYYEPGHEPGLGGAAAGFVRLGAERSMHEFTSAEQAQIVAAFDAGQLAAGFDCVRIGVDVWTAGNHDGPAGVREPRRPRPLVGTGTPAAPAPVE